MSPALLAPVALTALLALAIPLVIHIARRTQNRLIHFAALRWLDARPNPQRSVTVDERWLLAIRLLFLTLLAVWLARPVLWNATDDRPVIAIAPGVDADTIATLSDDNDRRIWLAPGFPAIGGPEPRAGTNVVSLLRQLDAELSPGTPVAVIVPPNLDGVDAERPRLSRRVDWRVATEASGVTSVRPTRPIPPPALTVRYTPDNAPGVRYFRAAATAWATPEAQPAFEAETVDRPLGGDTQTLIWLASGPVTDRVVTWVRNGGTILTVLEARIAVEGETTSVWRDEAGAPLALAGAFGRGRVIRLTRTLEPSEIPELVDASFPDALMAMLRPTPAPFRVATSAYAPTMGGIPYDQPPLDLRLWLALLIALALVGERWLATRPGRGVAP